MKGRSRCQASLHARWPSLDMDKDMTEGAKSEIERLILKLGQITFAQFMEIALFSPNGGYYTSGVNWGHRDFYTAPATHPAFGALLALQLQQVWGLMGCPSTFYVLEVGAAGGILAKDIVSYSSCLSPEFSDALQYIMVDYVSPPNVPGPSQIIKANGIPFKDLVGCILSNELLDAFPVHRFVIQRNQIKEIYVAMREGQFVEVLDESSTPMVEQRICELGLDLRDGFRGEVNLAMEGWIQELSRMLERGLILTIDYGHLAQDLYAPERSNGTLRCYYRHTLGGNPYRRIGRQDITAHVDFTSLIGTGEKYGLTTAGFSAQGEFLKNLGFYAFLDRLRHRPLPQRELDANKMGMLELIKPGEMGDFKVLAQTKGLKSDIELLGFAPNSPLRKDKLAILGLPDGPILSTRHMDLMTGKYPDLSWEWQDLWPFGGDN